MAALHKLTATRVKNARPGKYSDGAGLWLHKRNDGGTQWVLRLTIHGGRREMALGRLSDVSLKEARASAERWCALTRNGKDPIKERERLRRRAAREDHSLASVALEAFDSVSEQPDLRPAILCPALLEKRDPFKYFKQP